MRKIVFFDIDGTLLNSHNQIPLSTKEGIKKLREHDTYVAIATGRAPFMFEHIRDELDIDTYVSLNGQYVVGNNKGIYSNPQKTEDIQKLSDLCKTKEHPLVFMSHNRMMANVPSHPFIETSLSSLNISIPDYDETFYLKQPIYQTLLFCEQGEEKEYQKLFPMFRFIRWHRHAVDVIPAVGSKAEGIKHLIHELGFRWDDTYAFGDGHNDIEMLQTVGTGIAMGNAAPDVQKSAKYVTKHVDEDGILFGLKKINLI